MVSLQDMEKSEKRIAEALAMITVAIMLAKPEIFIDPADKSDLDVLGILVSKYTEWTGADILRVSYAALEDANFSDDAGKVADMYKELTGDNPWS